MSDTIDIDHILQAELTEAASLLSSHLRQCVRASILQLMDEEVTLLCGPRYAPSSESFCYRAGSAPTTVYAEGKPVGMRRPRVRELTNDGEREVTLKTLQAAREPGEWEEMVHRAILCGVSGRDQAKLQAHELRGMTKSNVCRLWAQRAGELIRQINETDLSDFRLLALMVDGFAVSREVHVIVALGIDESGHKRVLGFVVGATENYELCRDLLRNLTQRGLQAVCGVPLAVLDGADALRKAVLEFWPGAPVQRCLVHKERNLRGYLSRKHHGKLAALFTTLRRAQGEEAALEVLRDLETWLGGINAEALKSLQEAHGDLIAWFRLEAPATLNRTFLSTNHIENLMRNLRKHLGRVKRWRPETGMTARWVASGLWIAQHGFRRIQHYDDLATLAEALRNRYASVQKELVSCNG